MNPAFIAQTDPATPQLGRSVTIDQAALLLGVSRRTVYYRIREGRLRTIRTLGGSQRVLVESLHEERLGKPAYPVPHTRSEDPICQPR
jgi:excisionase family DNA binding protein